MGRVTVLAETGSTNADMVALAQAGWAEGRWLRAERQLAGRGRLGRAWHSPEGNLICSTLVRLRPGDPPVGGLGLLVGVALQAALAACLPQAEPCLKWPNDVMIGPAKLAGILLERVGDAVIVGIGVNVRAAPELPDRETIAIVDLPGGADVTAAGLLDLLADQLAHWLDRWRGEGFAPVRAAWLAVAHPIDTPLVVKTGDATGSGANAMTGRFLGLDVDGALILRLDDGRQHVIHSGDVGLS